MSQYRRGSHSIYDIKYHICWITKYRYHILRGEIGKETRNIIRQICSAHDVDIIVGSVGVDHIHLLVSCPPKLAVSKLIQYMRGTTSRKLQQKYKQLKRKYWGQHMWARGYFVVSSGNVTDEMWKRYIENQEVEEPDDGFRVLQ